MYVPKTSRGKLASQLDLRRSPEYVRGIKVIITKEFEIIKSNFIRKFNNHKVTKEIEAGPDSRNISGTLGGYGNLFSYIGFSKGDKPTESIRSLFKDIRINSINVNKFGQSSTFIMYPNAQDIFAVTPLPWADSRSWAEGVERGLPGLGYFLSKDNIGRSGAGIQTKNQVKQSQFQNVKYISSLINEFEKDILSLNNKVI